MVIDAMPTVTDQAICIRQWDFSETSQTVSLFGRSIGLFRALAKGSRRPKSRFSGGIDLLTMGDLVTIIKPGRDLCTLTEWGLSRVWWRIRQDVHANRIAYFISDCASRMLDQHDPHPGVFDAMVYSLDEIEQGVEQEFILTRFLWMLLVDVGYKPRLMECLSISKNRMQFSSARLKVGLSRVFQVMGAGGFGARQSEYFRWLKRVLIFTAPI